MFNYLISLTRYRGAFAPKNGKLRKTCETCWKELAGYVNSRQFTHYFNLPIFKMLGEMDITTSTPLASKIYYQFSYRILSKSLFYLLQVSSGFSMYLNFLQFSIYSSWNKGLFIFSPTEKPHLRPFHLFSEPVLARGIIGIGLFLRKSWNIVGNRSGFTGEIWFQQMQSMQVGWLEPTENIVNEELLAVNSLGIWPSWYQNRPKSDQNGTENRTC